VPGNPVDDIKVTQQVIFVMKDGIVYRNDRGAAPAGPAASRPDGARH
jgi:hypothetical protein